MEEIRGRNPIFQLNNEYPTRGIHKPNLIKSRYFRSAKGTPDGSFDENDQDYGDFDIDEVLDPKLKKKIKAKKLQNNTQDNKNYNPFKRGYEDKLKNEKKLKQAKADENDSGDEMEMEFVNNFEAREKNESEMKVVSNNIMNSLNNNNNNQSGRNQVSTLNNNQNTGGSSAGNNILNNNFLPDQGMPATNVRNSVPSKNLGETGKVRVEEKMFQNSIKEEHVDKEGSEKHCPVCQSASVINSKVRQKSGKKINPCLAEPQDIK